MPLEHCGPEAPNGMQSSEANMKRKGLLTILLVFGFLFSVFFLFVLMVLSSAGGDLAVTGVGIGVVEIQGTIVDSRKAIEELERFEDNNNIKAIIVRVDSPGGAVAPSQEVFQAVKRTREKKKVYISMGNLAASGGYYIACAGEKIYANPGTVTGSIGVITQLTNFQELAELAKVDIITIKSGKLKDMGNPFREFNEEDRQAFQSMVLNIYEQFIRDVANAREMKLEEVRVLADGRVYTGEQARKNGLVDELGSLQDTAAALAKEVGIEGRPKLIYPPKPEEDVLANFLQGSASQITKGVIEGAREGTAPTIQYRYVGPR